MKHLKNMNIVCKCTPRLFGRKNPEGMYGTKGTSLTPEVPIGLFW